MELLLRLDRAVGDRSGIGAEVQQDRLAAQVAQAQRRAAAGARQREVRGCIARQNPVLPDRSLRVLQQVLGAEVPVVVIAGGSFSLSAAKRSAASGIVVVMAVVPFGAVGSPRGFLPAGAGGRTVRPSFS
jgi:hypothetical protein